MVLFLMVGCNHSPKTTSSSETNQSQYTQKISVANGPSLEIYNFDGLQAFFNKTDNKIYVINFWATWCSPCVKELPYFEKLNKQYASQQVEVVLVSLDFPHQYDNKLIPFIRDNQLESKVVALDDTDMNAWIPKVDHSWSGAIPATLIYKNKKRAFFEKSFTFKELETELKQFLN